MTNDREARCRRAAYRATHRGTKEMDWLLGRFAAARVADMSPVDLARFEDLLALPDPTIEGWILTARIPKEDAFAELILAIRDFHGLPSDGPWSAPGGAA